MDKLLALSIIEDRPASLQCNWCPYRAKQPGHLREHERTHTGERPYKCRFCPKAAKTSSNIKVLPPFGQTQNERYIRTKI